MQRSKMIISVAFWGIMGIILASAIGVNPFWGMLATSPMNFVPMPVGVLGEGAISLNEEQQKFSDHIQGMLNTFKADLEAKSLNKDNIEKRFNEIQELINKSQNSKVDTLEKQLAEIEANIKAMGVTLDKVKNNTADKTTKKGGAFMEFVRKSLSDKSIESFLDGETKSLTFKANDMDSATVFPSGTVDPYRLGTVGPLPRLFHIRQIIATGSTDQDNISFNKIEDANYTKGGGAVAENAELGKSKFKYVPTDVKVKRIGAQIPISDNTLRTNRSMIMSDIENLTIEELASNEDYEILKGDGTGAHMDGLLKNATAFTDVVKAGHRLYQFQSNAQEIDVILSAIALLNASKFKATHIVLNSLDALIIATQKTSVGEYLLGGNVLVSRDSAGNLTINGIPVVETDEMDAGDFFIGNFQTAVSLYDWTKAPFVMKIVKINAQETTNESTIIFEYQTGLPIKRSKAFVKGSFSTAKAAIAKA